MVTKVKPQAVVKKPGKQRFRFIGEIISELRKVVWPPRREASYLTTLVVVVCVATAMVLWVIDLGFSKLMNQVLLR